MKCYILGAGASEWYSDSISLDHRPPGSNSIFKRGYELGILNEHDFPELCEAIIEDRGITTDFEDVEPNELVTDIEALLGRLEGRYRSGEKEEDLSKALGQCNFFLYELFRTFQQYYQPGPDNYTSLARYRYGHPYNIISLNYDLLVELALGASGLNFSYGQYESTPSDAVNIAKIHGSINFHVDLSPIMPATQPKMSEVAKIPFSNVFEGNVVKKRYHHPARVANTKHEDLIVSSDEYYIPALIPPIGENKPYRQFDIFPQMRRSAKDMLSDSDELVIIGSSMRNGDTVLHDILSSAGEKEMNVKIVSGSQSEEVADRVAERIPNADFDTTHERFTEYIESL